MKMRSGILLGVFLSTAGCGILSAKKSKPTSIQLQKNAGCFDELGPNSTAFIEGTADAGAWNQMFECVDAQIGDFLELVQAGSPDGYTRADVRALIQKFFIKEKIVNDGFVKGIFDFKRAWFGGSNEILSRTETIAFRSLLNTFRQESLKLLPYTRVLAENDPSIPALRQLKVGLAQFSRALGSALPTAGKPAILDTDAKSFIQSLFDMGFDFSLPRIQQYIDFIVGTKNVLIQGIPNGVGGGDWQEIFEFTAQTGVAALIFSLNENREASLDLELGVDVSNGFTRVINKWNGKIPFNVLQNLSLTIPDDLLTARPQDVRNGISELFKTQAGQTRAMISRTFNSETANVFDQKSLATLMNFYNSGVRTKALLDKIFENLPPLVSESEFVQASHAKKDTATDQEFKDLTRLERIAMTYKGMHQPGEPFMTFSGDNKLSRTHLVRMSWFELGSEILLGAYGSQLTSSGKAGTLEDMRILVGDVEKVLKGLSMLHPDKVDIHKKRFREANAFTNSGNGDANIDIQETSEYFAILFSASKLGNQIFRDTLRGPETQSEGIEVDRCPVVSTEPKLLLPMFEINCFRYRFQKSFRELFVHFPLLLKEYQNYTLEDRELFHSSLEEAAKFTGFDPNPISKYDMDSYSGVPHFAETVFLRFDQRGGPDGFLNRQEVIDDIYPVFKSELAKIVPINIDLILKASLLYLVQHGNLPVTKLKGLKFEDWVKLGVELGRWVFSGGYSKDFKSNRLRVYQVFGTLSAVTSTPTQNASSSSALRVSVSGAQPGTVEDEIRSQLLTEFPEQARIMIRSDE